MYFRTVRTVEPITGNAEIKSEVAGNAVRFQRDVIAWDRKIEPIIGQHLSCDAEPGADRRPRALNLHAI
jgi:hypothetical protein